MPYFSRNTVVVDSPLFSNISYSFGKVFPNIVGFHGDTVFACARALFFLGIYLQEANWNFGRNPNSKLNV